MTEINKKEKHKNVGPKWQDSFPDKLHKHLSEGYSFHSFAGEIKVNPDTLYEWLKRYPEFKEARVLGEAEGLKWFEKRLRVKAFGVEAEGLDPKLIDTACLIFALKTRFHKIYGDQSKVEHTVVRTIEDLVKEKKKEVIE
jgi:transposase-like protein